MFDVNAVRTCVVRSFAAVLAVATVCGTAQAALKCEAERPDAMAVTDAALCQSLESVIRQPSKLPLPEFERQLDRYFSNYCHRNAAAGWERDKYVRDTGPLIATLSSGEWNSAGFGTHTPVMIWYSPEMADWIKANRAADGSGPAVPPPVPDGAVIVKEMYPAPSSLCRNVDPLKLFPTNGAAIMIRDSAASHDGWFWGWYGFGDDSGWAPDWPPSARNGLPAMGFAQFCMNCHASAVDNLTFASASNIAGEPGMPLAFLSHDFFVDDPEPSRHQEIVQPPPPSPELGQRLNEPDAALVNALRAYAQTIPAAADVSKMPSQTYDNTWVASGGPTAADTFLTSSQCIGCHDAGSTGLHFDMTTPNPHGDDLLNLSAYATWRTSPMGLGGRDPIFFSQLASETQTFHPAVSEKVQDICLGCHGIGGQRQFHIDQYASTGQCPDFTRAMVGAVPWPAGVPGAEHANYGMLARDGITCTACHRMQIGDKAGAAVADEPQNACVQERQALLNPGLTGFGATFTGSFFVGAPDKLIGPFADPEPGPMKTAIGIAPVADDTILGSEICGSCHTVHLPVLQGDKTLAHIYEQTTYPEWAFSAYRTGKTAEGVDLPSGPGPLGQSCQSCHMPSTNADGTPIRSKIASIQETLNFPQTEYGNGPDLKVRENFARHTLVGLNIFLLHMAQQFPDILGIATNDPMLGKKGLDPLQLTEDAMIEQANSGTATVTVDKVELTDEVLSATVRVTNRTGHKFPSGVGFRRAFIAFDVFDQNGETIWASGRANAAGVIVDETGAPVDGELWWKDDCSAYAKPGERPHQPHFETVTRQDQAQIYQELVAAPPAGVAAPVCGHDAAPAGELTTSFLSICSEVKDNRILPQGYLPLEQRRAIARALGAGDDLAEDAGATATGDDPDYVGGGSDAFAYRIPLSDLGDARPASVEATLYYQAIPPYYLQDRLCTAKGPDVERLYYLVSHLNLDGTGAEGWKLKLVGSGKTEVAATP